MPSRREIRENVIQFLYCADIEGGASPESLTDTFWALSQESDEVALLKARVKALQHLNKGRESRFVKLIDRSETAIAHLATEPSATKLSKSLKDLINLESLWQSKLDRIRRIFDPERQDISLELQEETEAFFAFNAGLMEERVNYHQELADVPYLIQKLEPFTAIVRGLSRISERVMMVSQPEKFPDQAEVAHLKATKDQMLSLREEVDTLSLGVFAKKSQIDTMIAGIVKNYKPERINPVDRAVLRLASYEILFCKDIPTLVSINEAIELSRRYGTQDSPKFVNGILDSVLKSTETN